MQIILIRHAEAVECSEELSDADRMLSDVGRDQARDLAQGLVARGVEVGAVVSSPYVRAMETASELLQALKPELPEIFKTKLLAPGRLRPRKLTRFLTELGRNSVAIVGHMPELGEYGEWLLGARGGSLPLEKGAAACIRLEEQAGKGDGQLLWLVTPEWYQAPMRAARPASVGA